MYQYTKQRKQCGTCEYWSGPRQIHNTREYILFENAGVTGICCGKQNKAIKRADAGCHGWKVWNCFR